MSFPLGSLLTRVEPVKALPHSVRAYFLVGDLAVSTQMGPIVSTKGLNGGRTFETSVVRGTSTQDFLVEGGVTAMDSERRLHCLSLKPASRFVTMSFSSSTSQMIRGTTA